GAGLRVDGVADPVRGRVLDDDEADVCRQVLERVQQVLALVAERRVAVEAWLAAELERQEAEAAVAGAQLLLERRERARGREVVAEAGAEGREPRPPVRRGPRHPELGGARRR